MQLSPGEIERLLAAAAVGGELTAAIDRDSISYREGIDQAESDWAMNAARICVTGTLGGIQIDSATGLPRFTIGGVVNEKGRNWCAGYNDTIHRHIKQTGLPPHSALRWIDYATGPRNHFSANHASPLELERMKQLGELEIGLAAINNDANGDAPSLPTGEILAIKIKDANRVHVTPFPSYLQLADNIRIAATAHLAGNEVPIPLIRLSVAYQDATELEYYSLDVRFARFLSEE